MELVVAVVVSL